MNPLLMEALGSIVRWLLAGAAGWLVQHGIWTQAQSQTYVMAAALAVLSIGWSLWQKYKSRLRFLTALESPAGTPESVIKTKVSTGTGASIGVLLLLIAALLGAGVLASGCASTPPLVVAANAEHITVVSVHAVVQAEAQAYAAGAYDSAKHQQYVAALLKVVQSEKALNDALMTWNAASGQPLPAVVTVAVQNLSAILADVAPLIPANSAAATFAQSASVAITALTGGK